MGYIIGGMIVLSFVTALFSGNMEAVSASAMNGGMEAVELMLRIAGTLAFWSGMMEIADRSKLTQSLAKLFQPVTKGLLFPRLKIGSPALVAISANIAANLIGLGNAATPLGIQAMKELEKEAGYPTSATEEMITFVAINTASLQLIPTTTAFLRLEAGSANPMEILLPVWVSSLMSLIVAVSVGKLWGKLGRKNRLPNKNTVSKERVWTV